jgi:stage V sporulation protein D (sporulation-specific penicillin-binding protein)
MAIPLRQSEMVRHRVEKFFFVIASFYICLVVRLVYLQAIQGGFIRNEAAQARSRKIVLPATRGNFETRDGKPAAVTTHKFMLVADPTIVEDPQGTAAALAKLLGTDSAAILPFVQQKLNANGKPDRYEIIQREVDPEVVKAFKAATEDKKADRRVRKALQGVFLADRPERTYPGGSEGVHVIGMAKPGPDGRLKGSCGLEQSLNTLLAGSDGFMRAEVDPGGRIIPDTQIERNEPTEGVTVRLTIDSTIQHIVETELAKLTAEYRPQGATIVVMDPATGDVLAMASSPNFDPNEPKALAKSLDPLANHSLSLFEPGSTMKIITAAAALEKGVITPTTTFYCGGRYRLGNREIKCDTHGKAGGHGTVNIRDIIVHSCNVGTAQVGLKLGMDNMEQALRDFNMLEKTGIGLSLDTRGRLGLGAESARNGSGKLGRVAFGQAVMVTPLAMATAYSAIANNGKLMKPRLVLSWQDANGRLIKSFAPEAGKQVVRPETAAMLKSLLEGVVTDGTGKGSANIAGYTCAGKTGTAQRVPKGARSYVSGKYVASFIGFVPAKQPRVSILVLADQPQGGKYYGAQVGAPVFRSIGQQVMTYLKVAPDDPGSLSRVASNQ